RRNPKIIICVCRWSVECRARQCLSGPAYGPEGACPCTRYYLRPLGVDSAVPFSFKLLACRDRRVRTDISGSKNTTLLSKHLFSITDNSENIHPGKALGG